MVLSRRVEVSVAEIDQYPIGRESVYQDFHFFSFHPSILQLGSLQAPLLKVGEIPVGADKFSHFFTEGWHYFKKADLQGKGLEAVDTLYDEKVVSIDAQGSDELPQRMEGIQAVRGKSTWWYDNHEIHASSASGPYCGHRLAS